MAPQLLALATSPRCSGLFAAATLSRYALVDAGAPRRRGMLSLEAPAGLLASKGSRLAVVAAAAAAPGASDDGPPSDREGVVSAFRFEMQVFKMNHRPVSFLGEPKEVLDAASGTPGDCTPLMECLLRNQSVSLETYKELVCAGHALIVVEGQSKEGYLRADAVVNAIQGLKLVGETFFHGANLPEYTVPTVPLSGDDVDKESYFRELVNLFVVYYTALYWEAHDKYDFDPRTPN